MRSPLNKSLNKKAVLSAILLFYLNLAFAEKIGFVYMEKLIDESPQINQAKETITSEFERQFSILEDKESDLQTLENTITKDGAMMSLEELKKQQERARILERKIRRDKEDLNDAISIRRNQMLNKIQKDLGEVVKKYAIDNNYDAILINSILYVNEEMDITQEILDIIKTNYKRNEN